MEEMKERCEIIRQRFGPKQLVEGSELSSKGFFEYFWLMLEYVIDIGCNHDLSLYSSISIWCKYFDLCCSTGHRLIVALATGF